MATCSLFCTNFTSEVTNWLWVHHCCPGFWSGNNFLPRLLVWKQVKTCFQGFQKVKANYDKPLSRIQMKTVFPRICTKQIKFGKRTWKNNNCFFFWNQQDPKYRFHNKPSWPRSVYKEIWFCTPINKNFHLSAFNSWHLSENFASRWFNLKKESYPYSKCTQWLIFGQT